MGWCDGGSAAAVSSGGGRPERGPASAGTPAGAAGGLVDALTEHYSSPGRLADYRRRFQRASRELGADPSVFAVVLETLAMRAGDLSPLAHLQLFRDRFMAGQVGCILRRHLDCVESETHIRDIVNRGPGI